MNSDDPSGHLDTAPVVREERFLIRPMMLSATRREKWKPYLLTMAVMTVLVGIMAMFADYGVGRALINLGWALVLFGCHLVVAKYLFEKPLAETVMLHEDFLLTKQGRHTTRITLASIHHVEYRYFGFGNSAAVVLHGLPGKSMELLFMPADSDGWAPDGAHPVVEALRIAVQQVKKVSHEDGSI